MKNFKAQGNKITIEAPGNVVSGTPAVLEDRAGVYEGSADTGEDVVVLLEGIVELAKSAEAFAAGEKLYWNAGSSFVTSTASTNKPIGWSAAAAATGDTVADVKLGAF
jgi:predicted RecA/RadA family phage recombinase